MGATMEDLEAIAVRLVAVMLASEVTIVDLVETVVALVVIMLASVVTVVDLEATTEDLVATMVALVAAMVYWHPCSEAMVVNLQVLAGLVDTVAALVVMDPIGGHQDKDDVGIVISENVTFYSGLFILDTNTFQP